MSLTQNNCDLIKAVAENNLMKAKKAALASCEEDSTKKNQWFTERYGKILASGYTENILQNIPVKLKRKLVGGLPESFIKEHYFLSDREKAVFEQIYRMKIVAEEMQSVGISYKNTVLVYGESGTGKTMFGKYVAHRLQLPYFYLNFSHMVDSYMGATAGNINEAFSYIKTIPCVFLIDEIDCIASHRSRGGGKGPDGEIERTTISIMQELDTLPNNVILIGATNRKDLLDEALMRRFSIKHEVLPLSENESMEMAKMFLGDVEKKLRDNGKGIGITEDILRGVIREKKLPALIMTELIQEVGRQVYELVKDSIPENPWEEDSKRLNEECSMYDVTFSRTYRISSKEGKEAAVQAARRMDFTRNASSPEEKVDVKRI